MWSPTALKTRLTDLELTPEALWTTLIIGLKWSQEALRTTVYGLDHSGLKKHHSRGKGRWGARNGCRGAAGSAAKPGMNADIKASAGWSV